MVPTILKRTALLWLFALAACTIHLVPSYDQALVDGLTKANTEALTLFAELETNPAAAKFETYEPRYAALIGQFEALQQRAARRQIPPLANRLAKLKLVSDICKNGENPTACVNTSPASLARAIADFREMRNKHKSPGLQPDTFGMFRTDYNTAIAQAITVENALKR